MSKRDQRGLAVSVESAVLVPALVLFVGLLVFLAREALVEQAVGAAASQAARAASLERGVTDAREAARRTAAAALRDGNVECSPREVTLDAAGLRTPVGQRGRVSVTVSCSVAHQLSLPGFPGTREITQTRHSPVDTYRGR